MNRRSFIGLAAAAAAGTALMPETILTEQPITASEILARRWALTAGRQIGKTQMLQAMVEWYLKAWTHGTAVLYVNPGHADHLRVEGLLEDGPMFRGIPVRVTAPLDTPEDPVEP